MIAITTFRGRRVAVFGLGGSGVATALALMEGGADVMGWDDSPSSRDAAAAAGVDVIDWRGSDFGAFAALVLAPGVPLTHPAPHWSVEIAREAGVEVIGDIELFARERRAMAPRVPFIAVTGTNGKSTTTALIAHILRSAGRDVQLGGNIGTPILALEPPIPIAPSRQPGEGVDAVPEAPAAKPPGPPGSRHERVYVVECSSYQIDLAPTLDATVGVHLNISEDHLDRHGSLDHYAAVKERLVAGARIAVIGVDDPHSRAMADRREAAGRETLRISTQGSVKSGVWAISGRIVEPQGRAQTVVADLHGHPVLRGVHNAQNAAAAVAATRAIGLGLDEVRAGLASFPGLAHRMQPIGRIGAAAIVNDSKATNADAAARALASFDRIYWIAGGRPKSGGIEALRPYFPRIVRAYLIGEAAEDFADTLDGFAPFEICETLETAVPLALDDAAGDRGEAVVLLSPACASFDQFRNFEVRGDAFRDLVLAHPGVTPV
jgi:UDP-N-acetylmuramoylalanine--D-glutamate ligase